MLQFATIHSWCSPGGTTLCPGASLYATALPQASAAEPQWHYDETRKKNGKAPVLHGRILILMKFTVSVPWPQLLPVCYSLTRWSYGGGTVHAERASVLPWNKLALFRSLVRTSCFKKFETTGTTTR